MSPLAYIELQDKVVHTDILPLVDLEPTNAKKFFYSAMFISIVWINTHMQVTSKIFLDMGNIIQKSYVSLKMEVFFGEEASPQL